MGLRSGVGPQQKRLQVLEALRGSPGLSKFQLARRLSISAATAGTVVGELVRDGLIVSDGFGLSTGGRRPERLVLNSRTPLVLAVDLGETAMRLGLFNLHGRRLRAERHPFRRSGDTVNVEHIVQSVRGFLGPGQVAGVGFAIPGLVDREAGFVRYAANLGWHDMDLGALMERELGLPVTLDRGANAALLAEEWWGAALPATDPVLFVSMGSGIGAAIKINGSFARGASAAAGEVGHIPIDPAGPLCLCGKRGCLEALASGRALLKTYETLVGRDGQRGVRPLSVKAITSAAVAGDGPSRRALTMVAEHLGIGLVMLVNIFNPAALVLGGELVDAEEIVVPIVRRIVAERSLTFSSDAVTIRISTFRDEASLVGAAALAFQSLVQESG